MRFFCLLAVVLALAQAPTLPTTALERTQSIVMMLTAFGLTWKVGLSGEDHKRDMNDAGILAMAAAIPMTRTFTYVAQRDFRMNFDRVIDLFHAAGDDLEGEPSLALWRRIRFRPLHLPALMSALRIPAWFVTPSRYYVSGEEGLVSLLWRFAFPVRLVDMARDFGRGPNALSEIVSWMIDFLYTEFEHLWDWRSLAAHADQFSTYARAINAKGAPFVHIFGFVDGHNQEVARPGHYQNVLFSGHRWIHCLKWQGLMMPNGMQPFPFGPICGSNHDAFMLGKSNLLPVLHYLMARIGRVYSLYGDLAYPDDACLMRPILFAQPGSREEELNRIMSSLRIAVEWGFGRMASLWPWLDFVLRRSLFAPLSPPAPPAPLHVAYSCTECAVCDASQTRNMQVLLVPVGRYFPVANILTNCYTTLYGSQTGDYFGLAPPSLEEYTSGVML